MQAAVPQGEETVTIARTRSDEQVFPYRPHHYAYLHRRGSPAPPLYYAVTASRGGVPDRLATKVSILPNFESYLFLGRPLELSRSLLKFAERGGRASYPQFTAAQGIPT